MKSKLNIVVRDPKYPCKPYSETKDSFWVAVFNCDLTIVAVEPLTGPGPLGGNIYGDIEVPPGSYTVVGFSFCKNVWTNWTVVIAGCAQDVCVDLLPRKFEQCLGEIDFAAKLAIAMGQYSFSSPSKEVARMKKALKKLSEAIETLGDYLPKYELPVTIDDLRKAKAPEEFVKLWKEAQRRS